MRWYARQRQGAARLLPALRIEPVLAGARQSAQMDFALGAVDGPTGMHLGRHIYVEDKGDYYDIAAGEPQEDGRSVIAGLSARRRLD